MLNKGILKRSATLVGFLMIVILTGCAQMTRTTRLSVDNVTVAGISHRVEKNYLRLKSLKARAQFVVESPMMSFQASSKILIQKPDSLFIQLRAPFGIKVGSVFLDRNRFVLQDSWKNIVYTGEPDSLDLRKFLPIDLKRENILQLFSGIHLIDLSRQDSLTIDGNKYLITGYIGDKKAKYWIDPKKYVVTECHLLNDRGEPWIQFEYRQIEKKSRIYIPKIIRIEQPEQKTRLTILFSSRELNKPLNPAEFIIQIPPQSEVIEL